jgi:CMP-N,N'-diacetyllegionaminic acid synthase
MKVLGIIPARAGSKRVLNKNIRLLANKPLIVFTIEAAMKSKYIDRFIVSTDSMKIKEICIKAGADVPFLRPAQLSTDEVPDKPVILHTIDWLIRNENYQSDIIVLLRPTTPFKTPEIIDAVIDFLIKTNADAVRTVTKVEGVHHPYWMYQKGDNNRAIPVIRNLEVDKFYQSQTLPEIYRLNGVVDAIKTSVLMSHQKLYGDDMRIFEIPEKQSIDVDTEMDLRICELIMATS